MSLDELLDTIEDALEKQRGDTVVMLHRVDVEEAATHLRNLNRALALSAASRGVPIR